MIERAQREPKPKEMVEIVVGPGQVVLGPGKTKFVAGDTVEVPTTLVEKNPLVVGIEAVVEVVDEAEPGEAPKKASTKGKRKGAK